MLSSLIIAVLLLSPGITSVDITLEDSVRPLPPSVSTWTELDVEVWVNRTLGYPEYSEIVRTHLIDGPTLLFVDIEKAFQPVNPIHSAKIRAHIEILRGHCLCPKSSDDFWSFADAHRQKVFALGSTAMFLPRLSLLYVTFWDADTYNYLTRPSVSLEEELLGTNDTDKIHQQQSSWIQSVLFWFFLLFLPELYLAYQALAFWSSNYVVISMVIIYLLISQLQEGFFWGKLLVSSPKSGFVQLMTSYFGIQALIPPCAWLLSFILPYFLMQLGILVFFGYTALVTAGMMFTLFSKGSDDEKTQEKSD